jgi:hypothetical protein
MPINQKAMKSLKKEYGDKGERVYYALVNKGKLKEQVAAFRKNLVRRAKG